MERFIGVLLIILCCHVSFAQDVPKDTTEARQLRAKYEADKKKLDDSFNAIIEKLKKKTSSPTLEEDEKRRLEYIKLHELQTTLEGLSNFKGLMSSERLYEDKTKVFNLIDELVLKNHLWYEDGKIIKGVIERYSIRSNPKFKIVSKTCRLMGLEDHKFPASDLDGFKVNYWFDCPYNMSYADASIFVPFPKGWEPSVYENWRIVHTEGYIFDVSNWNKKSIEGDPTINWYDRVGHDATDIWNIHTRDEAIKTSTPTIATLRNFKKDTVYLLECYWHPIRGNVSREDAKKKIEKSSLNVIWYEPNPNYKEEKKEVKKN